MAHSNLFGRPGHGAPTNDIRKKKFTEYQLSDGTENGEFEHGMTTMDDSALPNPKPSYQVYDSNPYPRPTHQDLDNGMMNSRHLSKSEPDISMVNHFKDYLF